MVPPVEQIFILTDSLVGSGARYLGLTDGGSGCRFLGPYNIYHNRKPLQRVGSCVHDPDKKQKNIHKKKCD